VGHDLSSPGTECHSQGLVVLRSGLRTVGHNSKLAFLLSRGQRRVQRVWAW